MLLHRSAGVVISALLLTSICHGQGAVPSPPSSAFNWMNLNRNGNSAAANYYQLVRPNFQTQNALMNVQQDFNNLSQTVNNNDPNAPRATGHAATFMYYSHYYPRLGQGGGTAPRTGQSAAPGQRR